MNDADADGAPSAPSVRAAGQSRVRAQRSLDRGHLFALAALTGIALVSAAWWALALWPAAGGGPEWLARARYVCFGTRADGLPDAGGWILLVGQPTSMLGFLLIVWGGTVADALRRVARTRAGGATLATAALLLLVGLGAAAMRVWHASAPGPALISGQAEDPSFDSTALPPRLDREAPPLSLVDQAGDVVELAQLHDRPVLITFAFSHCETICPLVVHDVLTASTRARDLEPEVLVVTVDPWRDTPARLPAVASQWGLGSDAHVLSGDIDAVLGTLEAWNVPLARDEQTGDITHPALVYVIDRAGRIAWASSGGADQIVAMLEQS